jgi:ubiquinone biosynthesis protein COQ9
MTELTKLEKDKIIIYLHRNLKKLDFNNLTQDLFIKKINTLKFSDNEGLVEILADILFQDLEKKFLKDAMLKVNKLNKISEKIKFLLAVRFKIEKKSSELINKILTYLIKNNKSNKIITYIYSVADLMWNCANDRSVDFNYYTKRLILCFVYSKILFLKFFNKNLTQNDTEQEIIKSLDQVKIISKFKLKLDFFKTVNEFFSFFTPQKVGRGF